MTNISSLYIHIPFCLSKCKYCDFFSIPCDFKQNESVPDRYILSVCNEITYQLKRYNIDSLETIYIGGGTPSLLNKNQLKKIFDTIKSNSDISFDCEITIESNPDDITEKLIKDWCNLGINRISLGIQSFDDKALSYVSRRATSSVNKHAIYLLKQYWKGQLSVDFICGLPNQSSNSFLNDINHIIKVRPDHISMYSLTIEDETPLGREFNNGKLEYNFDFADDLWLQSKDLLIKNGYKHYEVSNFCLPNLECKHNLKYWNHQSYIGVGSGGTGTVYLDDGSGFRWTNVKNIQKYVDFWNNPICAEKFNNDSEFIGSRLINNEIINWENISLNTSIFEFFMMGLRKLSGVTKSQFVEIFKKNIPDNIVNNFNRWNKKGLCNISYCSDDINFTLGPKGIIYLNKFLEEII